LRDRVREQDRRLHAAADYARETAGELAEHRAIIELLRREVDVLRRQVDILSQGEPGRSALSHTPVARVARQVTAEEPGAPTSEPRSSLPAGGGAEATGFGYRVSSRPAGEASPELFAEISRRWEDWDRKRRARTDRTVDPGYHRKLVGFKSVAVCLGLMIVGTIGIAVYVHTIVWGLAVIGLVCAWLLFAICCWGQPQPDRENWALPALRHPWQVWPCRRWVVRQRDGTIDDIRFTLLDPEGLPVAEFTTNECLSGPVGPVDSGLELVWVAGTFDSRCVIAFPSPVSWQKRDAILAAVSEPIKIPWTIDPDEFASLVNQARNAHVD
ncbi:hypothetical protein, partial [Streptomyces sp. SID3343]|uniref:hypothetical protein n=1 Tax=Streptomyces sp. SID3343 TaxID=2690260 RepID=UPI00136F2752